MEGASVAGAPLQRAEAALAAGCDVALICNNRPAAKTILFGLRREPDPVLHARLARLHGRQPLSMPQLQAMPAWQQAVAALNELGRPPLVLES
jgi:beta-N-acetylhexosaminidase